MRQYAMLSHRFWTGTTGKALRDAGQVVQLVAVYLLSSPHSNFLSIYRLPMPYAAADLRMPEEEVRKAMLAIESTGFIKYDHDADLVWIVEGARWQIGESLNGADKKVLHAQREFDQLPPHSPLRQEFFARYGAAYQLKMSTAAIKNRPMRKGTERSAARTVDVSEQSPEDWDVCADMPQERLRDI